MTTRKRSEENVQKLIELARASVAEQQNRLSDIELALKTGRADQKRVLANVKHEDNATDPQNGADIHRLAAYRNGALDRQKALQATIDMLTCEAEEVRDELRNAQLELNKLERLLEIRSQTEAKRVQRKYTALQDEMVSRIAR